MRGVLCKLDVACHLLHVSRCAVQEEPLEGEGADEEVEDAPAEQTDPALLAIDSLLDKKKYATLRRSFVRSSLGRHGQTRARAHPTTARGAHTALVHSGESLRR